MDERVGGDYGQQHQTEHEVYGRWGAQGRRGGVLAIHFLAGLVPGSEEERGPIRPQSLREVWNTTDYATFTDFTEFDETMDFISPHESINGHEVAELHGLITDLHGTLPFGEVETQWLRATLREHPRYEDDAGSVLDKQGDVFINGVRTTVEARELVQRWRDWRHEVREFQGQGSLGEATKLTAAVARVLVPESAWPEGYEALRDRQW